MKKLVKKVTYQNSFEAYGCGRMCEHINCQCDFPVLGSSVSVTYNSSRYLSMPEMHNQK